ncbi:MAG: diacylglycerol kinase family protein [Solirubrobacteraceae bacterium]
MSEPSESVPARGAAVPTAEPGERSVPTPPTGRRRVTLIVNPNATTTSPRTREAELRALAHRFDIDPVDTEAPGHAIALARDAVAAGADAVFALGGDGTANEAANGLVGTTVPLVPLPGGATNVFHRLIGIPRKLTDATDHVIAIADRWEPRATDLAKINDRWFTFAAGIGLDAAVVRSVDLHPRLKRRLGPWYYSASAVATFLREYVAHAPRLSVSTGDGRVLEGRTAIFQNAVNYTYFSARPIRLLHGQGHTTGTLSGAVLRHTRPTIMPGVIARAVVPALDLGHHRAVEATGDVPELTVRSLDGRPMPTHVDGDYIGTILEARLSVGPGALWVLS